MAKKFLIVDDNKLNMKPSHISLESNRYHVIEMSYGKGSLKIARARLSNLFLMVPKLRKLSSLEVTEWLKTAAIIKSIEVLARTAFAIEGDKDGCKAYLEKRVSMVCPNGDGGAN